ncbi:MAG: hypothetical protein HY255_00520 [Betaproteobacteria bacterium]|nr:hypothetical protein [Betaproteobacteria bacterium]
MLLIAGFAMPAIATISVPIEFILGRWQGTSICTKVAGNESCHDETVRYEFARSAQSTTALTVNAEKLVNGQWVSMGELEFHYSAVASRWECEFQGRVRALWTFAAKGDDLTGTLYILPERWVARNAKARKVTN